MLQTQTLVEKPKSLALTLSSSAFFVQSSKLNTLLSSLAFPQNRGIWVPTQHNVCTNFQAFFGTSFFFLHLSQSFCHRLETLLKLNPAVAGPNKDFVLFCKQPHDQPEFSFVCDVGYAIPRQCSNLLT